MCEVRGWFLNSLHKLRFEMIKALQFGLDHISPTHSLAVFLSQIVS